MPKSTKKSAAGPSQSQTKGKKGKHKMNLKQKDSKTKLTSEDEHQKFKQNCKPKPSSGSFENIVPKTIGPQKFFDEPKAPIKTTLELYVQYRSQTDPTVSMLNKKQRLNVCKPIWQIIPWENEIALESVVIAAKHEYGKQLLEFVEALDEVDRSNYLGHNRKKLFRFFKKDIFAQLYPNSLYPVFSYTPSKRPKQTVVLPEGLKLPTSSVEDLKMYKLVFSSKVVPSKINSRSGSVNNKSSSSSTSCSSSTCCSSSTSCSSNRICSSGNIKNANIGPRINSSPSNILDLSESSNDCDGSQ